MSHSCLSSSPGPIPLIFLVLFPALCPHHLPRGPQDTSVTLPALSSHTGSPSQSISVRPSPRSCRLTPQIHLLSTSRCQHHSLAVDSAKGMQRSEENRQGCEHRIQQRSCNPFKKEAGTQPLASLGACLSSAQHRPCPSSSGQHTKHFYKELVHFCSLSIQIQSCTPIWNIYVF